MANFNKVILAGNLTRDPELRYTPKGTAVARFTLALNRSWKTETGEAREEVAFIDVDSFGRQAETICQYMKKGSAILVEGRLKMDQWDDKQTGQKRSKLGVVLEGFTFIGGGSRSNAGGAEPGMPSSTPSAARATAPAPSPEADTQMPEEDDVPF